MNVLFLTQFFSTTRGGGEYLFSVMARELSKNNHKVWVITNRIIGEEYKEDKVKIIFVKPDLEHKGGLPPKFLDNIKYSINSIREGRKIIKNENIDVIHSNNFAPALAGSILSFLTKKPHVTAIWDIFTLCGKDYWNKWVKQSGVSKIHEIIGPKFEKLILKIPSSAIHTISEATKEDLLSFGSKKPIHVILPSIETISKIDAELNPFQFVCIGRLVFYKNVEILIRAFAEIKKIEPKVKLIIVGGGPHINILKNLTNKLDLESNIEFKGFVTEKEKMKIVSESNSLLFPSLCEGFGLVILEAFSQAKPVLVSNIRPMSDIVEDKETGYVIDPQNEAEWIEKILNLIKNPSESKRMGNNGFQNIGIKYNKNKMSSRILEMYQKVISRQN
jgi:glycosyltransferase involved in cell wall biosynthesis